MLVYAGHGPHASSKCRGKNTSQSQRSNARRRRAGHGLRPLLLTANGPQTGDGRLRVDVVAVHIARGVELPLRPVIIRPLTLLAVEVQVDPALGLEQRLLLGTGPGLVDGEQARRSRVRKGGATAGTVVLDVALVDDGAVEKVGELVGGGGADGLVLGGRVLEGKVDVAPRVLVGGRGEDLGGMEVELADFPELDLGGLVDARLFFLADGICWHGKSDAGQEEGVEDSCIHCVGAEVSR